MTTAAKFGKLKGGNDYLSGIEKKLDTINNTLDPFRDQAEQTGQVPFYSGGARALIRIGGRPIGVAQEIKWNVSYNAEPINTIDSVHTWDIDVGVCRINASLSQFMDPTKGPEVDYLFHTMQSAIHQPFVEMQVLDKFGTSLFFARGAFVAVSGSVARGQNSSWTANFVGTAYQHYVAQGPFKPYSAPSKAAGLLNTAINSLSNITGGLL